MLKFHKLFLRLIHHVLLYTLVHLHQHRQAEDDIYGSRKKYESFEANLEERVGKPKKGSKRKYYCKSKVNIKYFRQLMDLFDVKDLSYIRRNKVLATFRTITFILDKDLKTCKREDINKLIAFMHKTQKSPESKSDLFINLAYEKRKVTSRLKL